MTDEPRWLDADERAAWLALTRLTSRLPGALDAQLERDAGLSYIEYIVLAMLSEQADRTLRMSRLAAVTSTSLSRLSHVVKRLEARDLVTRATDERDRRATNATITDTGLALVVRVAPAHVAHVRELVLDALGPGQLGTWRAANERVLDRIDPDAVSRPPTP
ncbi:MarR family winged helix-turn-helix transcriptional regulator [Angustibacter aerolatus]